ncbi:hypothetical protein D9758_006512 [Tetrapyrgos nigripes]|uniref:Zn(2)-C6 fungal-type domain-containing protein n=1 Tax=Tetrapyrgos nigripes TaxID=182062 RepID=A0A8H5GKP8_9AGAR|nr:hypothetical protein D9758_006512 [Tetrapyrgos nigripes]
MSSGTSKAADVSNKPKKPPACDYCKARRVLCHPQPDGRPCPRCAEKDVQCTTTPSVRRKRRPQHEVVAAKEMAAARSNEKGNRKESKTRAMVLATSRPQSQDTGFTTLFAGLPRVIDNTAASSRPELHLPTQLIQDLFDDFVHTTFHFLPIIPYDRLRASLAGCGWQPASLAPQDCVLVYCIFAVTSFISTHPFIVGPEPLPPECTNILTTIHQTKTIRKDLRDIGRRREGMCQLLRAEALRQAQIEGIAVWVSPENAASCCLLATLENQNEGPSSYDAAFAWQTRALAESWYRQPQPPIPIFGTTQLSVQWSGFLMVGTISALNSDRSASFTAHDEHLICGHDQLSLEKLALVLSRGCDRLQFSGSYFIFVMFQITRHARKVYETVSGPYARGHPCDLQVVKRCFTSLSLLHDVCDAYNTHGLLLSRQSQSQSQSFLILSFVGLVQIGWSNLSLYFYRTIKAMWEEDLYTATPDGTIDDGTTQVDCYESGSGADGPGHAYERATCSSMRAELASIFLHARALACKAAIEFSKMIEEFFTVSRLAHLKILGGDMKKWVEFLIEVTNAGSMSPSEGIQTLERLRDGLKIAGFVWADYTDFVEVIDSHISALRAGSAIPQVPAQNPYPNPNSYNPHSSPLSHSDSHYVPQSIPQSGIAPTENSTHNPYPNLNPTNHHSIPHSNFPYTPSAGAPPLPPPPPPPPLPPLPVVGLESGISPYDPLFSGYTYGQSSNFDATFEDNPQVTNAAEQYQNYDGTGSNNW